MTTLHTPSVTMQPLEPLSEQEQRALHAAQQVQHGMIARARARRAFRRLPLPAKALLLAAGAYLAALNFAWPIYCATKPELWVLKRGGWAGAGARAGLVVTTRLGGAGAGACWPVV